MELIDYILIILSAAFGLSIGSFLNVCIYRIPRKEFFGRTRSYCPKCGVELRWYHNVPLFSYLFLGGRCGFCKQKISPRYPIVEALNMLLWVASYLVFRITYATLIFDIAISVLIVITFIDLDIKEIPNGSVLILIVLGVLSFFLIPEVVWWHRLIGAFCVSLPMFIIALITGGIGGGDIKLFFAAGLLLGYKMILVSALIAVLLGGIGACVLMIFKHAKKGTEMPFGPYIAFSIILTAFVGEQLLNGYMSLFG
jgi:leader peptidase (prepilin peptidase)/N-methyltransferase